MKPSGFVVEYERDGVVRRSEPVARFGDACALRSKIEGEVNEEFFSAYVRAIYTARDGAVFVAGYETSSDCGRLKCPHCGEWQTDLWEHDLADEESTETECGDCGKPYMLVASVSIDYTATALVPGKVSP